MALLDRRERVHEGRELDRFIVLQVLRGAAGDTKMRRNPEAASGVLGPYPPVLDVMGQRLLSQVEVDGGHPLAEIHQPHGDMHGDGGLPRTALLVAHDDDVRRCRPLPARLHQHENYLTRTISF
jgi:hypothetical protein